MPSLHETAYPRLKTNPDETDLEAAYTATLEEIELAKQVARNANTQLGFLVLLKTFQCLGYFTVLQEVPSLVTNYLSKQLGFLLVPPELVKYDSSGSRHRHKHLIREHLSIKPFTQGGMNVLNQAVQEASQTREDLTDIINVALERLVQQNFELCGFTVLVREARAGRKEVNDLLYEKVAEVITQETRMKLDVLGQEKGQQVGTTLWQDIKRDPGKPTLKQFRESIKHWHWLLSLRPDADIQILLPDVKLRQFADEASKLDSSRMMALGVDKRYTFALALLAVQLAKQLDDLTNIFIRRITRMHTQAKADLEMYQLTHQARTDNLIATFRDVLSAHAREGSQVERFVAMDKVIAFQAEQLLEHCDAHSSHANNNYYPFLWRHYSQHRSSLMQLWKALPARAATQDTSFMDALDFVLSHQASRREWLENDSLDLSWLSEKWWKHVTGKTGRISVPELINRKYFELAVFSQLKWELKALDVWIEGSLEFADYRKQLLSDEAYSQMLPNYQQQVGLATDPKIFVAEARAWLDNEAKLLDESIQSNDDLHIEEDRLVLKQLKGQPKPAHYKAIEQNLKGSLGLTPILNALTDSENLLNWSSSFGPLSGHEGKLPNPQERYLQTVFCYGCNLGPSQTARSLEGADRRQLAWVNYHHISEEALDKAIVKVVNAYNRFRLPKLWGSGKSVSADGKKWDVYEQNLLAEYHIRYGGYGGLGYYHVSDNYIALFSRFIPCGVYEAVYILDAIFENETDLEPDTIHADSQGQSTTVFALAYLLGIDLMPRIRNWKDLVFFKADKASKYEHIDSIFGDVIDWHLIETHLLDMLRVVLSIQAGTISASTLLKRLGTYSRKNRLYLAFRELGRVVRTVFLMRYAANEDLQRTILSATNKSEQFNGFLEWLSFGGEVIATNNRDEQSKRISISI